MKRISADNKTTYTARIRIKGYRQQTATFPRITDARLWIQKTESLIREGKYFSQAEAKRHTFADMTERYIKTVLPNKSAKVGFGGESGELCTDGLNDTLIGIWYYS